MNKLMILATALLLNILWSSKASALLCAVSATSMVFGNFSPLTGSEIVSTSNINVTCDASSSYTIALSPGGSGTYSPRRMANGGNTLEYNLFRDAGYSQIWGDGTGGSHTVVDSGIIGSKDYTVYGRFPLSTQRNAMVGSYSDSITVTLTY
jgi:spore coat protein U-like protein